jgi:RNA polymerase sigma-70 factor, ECF subfamily
MSAQEVVTTRLSSTIPRSTVRRPTVAGNRCRDERDVIMRAQQGDQQAFAKLYESHKRRVYWLCFRMVHQADEAEDLTQEAFLQVYRKLNTYRGESAFSTWLHRVAVNVVLMRLRKRGLTETSLDEMSESDEDNKTIEIGSDDPLLSGSVDRIVLENAIDELPPGYRLVFVLHDVHGYEHQEIADILGCTTGNCKSQLHKARLKLRAALRHKRRM